MSEILHNLIQQFNKTLFNEIIVVVLDSFVIADYCFLDNLLQEVIDVALDNLGTTNMSDIYTTSLTNLCMWCTVQNH